MKRRKESTGSYGKYHRTLTRVVLKRADSSPIRSPVLNRTLTRVVLKPFERTKSDASDYV